MVSVTEHYESHLAPIYVWMMGGVETAITRGRAEVDAVCPHPSKSQRAVDLGAGFGMHTIPLADIGYSVLAIDSSGTLLDVMKSHLGARPVKTVRDDLLSFRKHLDVPAALTTTMAAMAATTSPTGTSAVMTGWRERNREGAVASPGLALASDDTLDLEPGRTLDVDGLFLLFLLFVLVVGRAGRDDPDGDFDMMFS